MSKGTQITPIVLSIEKTIFFYMKKIQKKVLSMEKDFYIYRKIKWCEM